MASLHTASSSSDRPVRSPVLPAISGLIVLLGALAVSAYWQLFTTFRFWDDEGYVLTSLRNFSAGGKLYTDVYSQYGPVYNLLFGALHRFAGLPLDSVSARWLTLASWIGATLASALLVRQLTRSWLWSGAGCLAAFFQLRLLTHEPLHPVGLLSVLLVAGSALAVNAFDTGATARGCVWAAITGVLMALVKINVGLFYLAAVGTFAVWTTRGPLARPWARWLLTGLALGGGAVLMRPLLQDTWVREFLVVYTIAALSTLGVVASTLPAKASSRELLRPVAIAAVVTAAAVALLAVISDIGLRQLLDGVIRGPLRHPGNFSYPFRWSGLAVPVLGANGLAFGLWFFLRRRNSAWSDRLLIACRLVVGTGLLISYFHGFAVSVEAYLLSFGAGFCWALAAPLGTTPPQRHGARQLLALFALWQILHAFPVAGTQLNLGTLLLALLILVGLAEVAAALQFARIRHTALALASCAFALPAWGVIQLSRESAHRYFRQSPECFVHSGLRLSPWQASTFAVLAANAKQHGDMLFSLPGMFSFNLWTGLPTPTRQNITQWWSLLDDTQQAEIATQLSQARRPVILVQRNLITSGLAKSAYHPSLLTRFIEDRFTPIFSLDSYEFWVRRDAHLQPLLIARWQTTATTTGFRFHALETNLAATRRIEFRHYDLHVDELVASLGDFTLEPSEPTVDHTTPWTCRLTPPPGLNPAACDAARFFDASGKLIIELRFERPKPQANPE